MTERAVKARVVRRRAGMSRGRPLLAALALVCAIAVSSAAAEDRRAGQEARLAEMFGRGAVLPGGCRFTGGTVNDLRIVAEYACGERSVAVELRRTGAPSGSVGQQPGTSRIAVVRGQPPLGLVEALTARIGAGEAGFEWSAFAGRLPIRLLGVEHDASAGDLLTAGCALVGLCMAVQYFLWRRRRESDNRPVRQRAAGRPARDVDPAQWAALVCVLGVFLVTRLTSLGSLPVFIDEALHIAWARPGLGENLVQQFAVGKWLPIQAIAISMYLPLSPPVAARSASVVMGLLTAVAVVAIGRALFSFSAGVLAATVYAMLPFALFNERLALADIYVTAAGAWLIYASIAAIGQPTVGWPLGMTAAAAAAIFAKPTGAVLLLVPAAAAMLLVDRRHRVAYLRAALPPIATGFALLALLLATGYGAGLVVSQSGLDGRDPLAFVGGNLARVAEWLQMLLTWPVVWATGAAVAWALVQALRGDTADAFLVAVLAIVIAPYVLVARKLEPRYLLPATVPVSLLLGHAIAAGAAAIGERAARRWPRRRTAVRVTAAAAMVAVLGADAARLDRDIIIAPAAAALPAVEREQYVTAWSSGYGLPELAAFLRSEARRAPVNVVRIRSDSTDVGLDAYLSETESLRLYSIDPSDAAAAAAIGHPGQRTLLLANRDAHGEVQPAWTDHLPQATRVWSYERPGALSTLEAWELAPSGG
jgi:hypothetical protein